MLRLKYAPSLMSGTTTHEATSAAPPKTTAARPMRGTTPRQTTITNTPMESNAKYPVRKCIAIVKPTTSAASAYLPRPVPSTARQLTPHASGSRNMPHSCDQRPLPSHV